MTAIRAVRAFRVNPRAVAVEGAIVVSLGAALAAASLGLLVYGYGGALRLGGGDVAAAGAAGLAAAAVVRLNVRLHRAWKRTLGRFTAAAALCALAAVIGALAVMIPADCPGGLFGTGRCGVREAAAWGQVAGLAAVLHFAAAGLALASLRLARRLARTIGDVVRDGASQGVLWARALSGVRSRRAAGRTPDGPARRDPREPKGRPTPRRADAERARRKRLRHRA